MDHQLHSTGEASAWVSKKVFLYITLSPGGLFKWLKTVRSVDERLMPTLRWGWLDMVGYWVFSFSHLTRGSVHGYKWLNPRHSKRAGYLGFDHCIILFKADQNAIAFWSAQPSSDQIDSREAIVEGWPFRPMIWFKVKLSVAGVVRRLCIHRPYQWSLMLC